MSAAPPALTSAATRSRMSHGTQTTVGIAKGCISWSFLVLLRAVLPWTTTDLRSRPACSTCRRLARCWWAQRIARDSAQQRRSNSALRARTKHHSPAGLLWCNGLSAKGLWWALWWGSLDGRQGGQGFKSPQVHQAQRIGSTPARGRLAAGLARRYWRRDGLAAGAGHHLGVHRRRQRCRSWFGHVRTPEGPVPAGSQPPRCSSRSRSSTRRILPEMVLGSSSVNSISRGYL